MTSTRIALALALVYLAGTAGCSSPRSTAGQVIVQISGEAAATEGFAFPRGSDAIFMDGWELHFEHVLVTVSDVTLSENPDAAPTDQLITGAPVARAEGPWAVDLAVPGTVPGAGGEGLAVPLATLTGENLRGNADFAADERYAFSYRIVRATAASERVNFTGDDGAENLYARMIERGYAVLYTGTATFAGLECLASDPTYDFGTLPSVVPFELGFTTPASYVNCQNQENQGEAFEGEEYQRGIALASNQPTLAQITLHLEHPFLSDTVHDSPIFFDQMAAALDHGTEAPLQTEDFSRLDPTAFVAANGKPLPWRSCLADQTFPSGKQRGFGVGHVLVDRSGSPAEVFRDYRDFVNYVQSTQGHLNGGEGLCAVVRDYPAPR